MLMKPSLWIAIAICFAFSISLGAEAADFKTVQWRGHQALSMTGPIDEGSAAAFKTAIAAIQPAPNGVRIMLLDSPGGLVSEAFAMSDLMVKYPVHTVIPDGATCASACASIVFIAGTYRTVATFGLLGQHSCALNGIPDQKCNDVLSENAVRHGVDYGAVSAFVTLVKPEDIVWLARTDVDALEISKYAGSDESNYTRLAPRIFEEISHKKKPAQAAWRLDFREDGYQAFLRPVEDDVRQAQLNLFCNESLKGRLFIGMELNAPVEAVRDAVESAELATDTFDWKLDKPLVWQEDKTTSEIIMEIPQPHILDFLTKSTIIKLEVTLNATYPEPMKVATRLDTSRQVLTFAADHCVSGHFDGPMPPIE